MKPIFKYRGGKAKEIPLFSQFIPTKFNTYYEPFVGGGAVYFHINPIAAVINDINTSLMKAYTDFKEQFETSKQQLLEIQLEYEKNQKNYELLKSEHPTERVPNDNENLYYRIRDMYNNKIEKKYLDSVVYYFINKTAYSGMIRYNASGDYNVPYGRYKNFNTELVTNEHYDLLSRTKIFNVDYSTIFDMANENDFMFLDPPYDCIFNDYGNLAVQAGGFTEDEHKRLASDFKNLSCKALMVIGKTPLTEGLYHDYIAGEYKKIYSVNIRNRFKSSSDHIIVTNY